MNKVDTIKSITGIEDEFIIQYALERIEYLILNYTNRKRLPKELDMVHIDMTLMDLYRLLPGDKFVVDDEGSSGGEVNSVTVGDTRVEYKGASEVQVNRYKDLTSQAFKNELLNDYRHQLNEFRLMKWG